MLTAKPWVWLLGDQQVLNATTGSAKAPYAGVSMHTAVVGE
jgi:hypothetical protein